MVDSSGRTRNAIFMGVFIIGFVCLGTACQGREIKMEKNPRFLTQHVGRIVILEGRVAEEPWQLL